MTTAAERALLDAARDVEMPGAGQLQRVRLSLAARAVKADGTLAVETQELAAAAQKYCECLGQNPATAEALGALVAAAVDADLRERVGPRRRRVEPEGGWAGMDRADLQ